MDLSVADPLMAAPSLDRQRVSSISAMVIHPTPCIRVHYKLDDLSSSLARLPIDPGYTLIRGISAEYSSLTAALRLILIVVRQNARPSIEERTLSIRRGMGLSPLPKHPRPL